MTTEAALEYLAPSTLDGASLDLATSGGREAHPYFFEGFVARADQAARGLLAVAEVSRTRYFDAGAATRMKDPVVTSNLTVLRFESFSSCNGVYARLDIDADGFDADRLDWGTTNVDLNERVREALATVGPGEPLRLTVGTDSMGVATLGGSAVERKVPLPERWLRGFAEAQIAQSSMLPVAQLRGARAAAAIRDLPRLRSGARTPWVSLGPGAVRMTSMAGDATPCLVEPRRLATLGRLARWARSLTVYAPPPRNRLAHAGSTESALARQGSAWVLELDGARYTLVVSPEQWRGFSGEGAVLTGLAHVGESDVVLVAQALRGQAELHADDLGDEIGMPGERVRASFAVLGAAGRVGYDLHTGAYFHRDLPYDRSVLSEAQPRLRDAWDLVATGAVTAGAREGEWLVDSAGTRYLVTLAPEADRCLCPWFAKHRGERGPCKHVLAATLTATAQG
ncbi:SWIM zinc finger family protein [Demequina sp. NBRC 110056]|uniref:SWIM zinc finger family protein n=1 Tax=Demequina sp. NBRC 110056 TaxID=1570345 RepID=UPI0009FBB483|nr:SWIM zinc finger family protein [Demequina sp. NBRC 110056]